MQCCSLQHRTLPSPPDTSTAEHRFCFGLAASFFLKLWVIALRSSPVAYWTPSDLGGLSSHVISFCLFILFIGLLRQEYWNRLPFPPPVDQVLSELFTMTCLSWVALHRITHSFIQLCKPLYHNKAVIHEVVVANGYNLANDAAWNFPLVQGCGSSLSQEKMEGHMEIIALLHKGLDNKSSLRSD